jgi:hypothetical protein
MLLTTLPETAASIRVRKRRLAARADGGDDWACWDADAQKRGLAKVDWAFSFSRLCVFRCAEGCWN